MERAIEMNSLSANLSLFLISFVVAADAKADFVLAAGGKPRYVIVQASEATQPEQQPPERVKNPG